jgi:Uma2 family endonuclease
MNEHTRPTTRPPTQAAEGVPRWRWTTAELLRLTELGTFDPQDRFELIGGEIVPMSPKGRRHELIADELGRYWSLRVTTDIWVSTERQFNLSDDTYTAPDLLVRPSDVKVYDVRGDTALLVVEIAQSSLAYDQTTKAALYARFGVREYWVIDVTILETHVHLAPGPEGYASVTAHPGDATLQPTLVPALAVRLRDLDID